MENYASVAPNPPPRDAPLGSSPANSAHSYQLSSQPPSSMTIREGQLGSDQTFSDFPSVSQQAALTTLQDCDIGIICAWLTGFRSGENWFQPSCLSVQQLEAVAALKDCTHSLVSAWFTHICRGGQYASQCRTNNLSPNTTA